MLAGVGILLRETAVHGQAKFDEYNIVTADSVKLKARYYPSAKGQGPTVILLHPIGDGKSMDTPEWKSLAETLQKANFSVMMFDFRGHGESTTIDDPKVFWSKFPNANVKPAKAKVKDEIYVADYIKNGNAYLPILVNDIAAVRAFLDRRNDNPKDCNTSNIFVIGADSGATLGALWINSEWHRYKYIGDHKNFLWKNEINKPANYVDCAGSDITGAVFLTISPTLEKRAANPASLLSIACKERAMAALFMCGNDKKAVEFNDKVAKSLKVKDSTKHAFIGHFELNTKLSGINLLQKGLKNGPNKESTENLIAEYLTSVLKDRKAESITRDFLDTDYRWKGPKGGTFSAKESVPPFMTLKKGEKTLLFDDYASKFLK
jgi:hypothetical protein